MIRPDMREGTHRFSGAGKGTRSGPGSRLTSACRDQWGRGGSEGSLGRSPGWSPSADGQCVSLEAPTRGLEGGGQCSDLSGPGPGVFASAGSDSESAVHLHPSDPGAGGGEKRREPGRSPHPPRSFSIPLPDPPPRPPAPEVMNLFPRPASHCTDVDTEAQRAAVAHPKPG